MLKFEVHFTGQDERFITELRENRPFMDRLSVVNFNPNVEQILEVQHMCGFREAYGTYEELQNSVKFIKNSFNIPLSRVKIECDYATGIELMKQGVQPLYCEIHMPGYASMCTYALYPLSLNTLKGKFIRTARMAIRPGVDDIAAIEEFRNRFKDNSQAEFEFCLVDTNEKLDEAWLNSYGYEISPCN